MTLLDRLAASLRNRLKPADGEAPPSALLWTDAERRWQALMPAALAAIPELFILGSEYAPDRRSGPAIWLKCVVDRAVPEAPETAPVLYLPGVSRPLEAECLPRLQPLVELQYRGRVWMERGSGRDWSVAQFLASPDEGLGLDLAPDTDCEEAAIRNLVPLAALSASELDGLRERRLHGGDFYALRVPDPDRELLRWMSMPELADTLRARGTWEQLCAIWKKRFGFDADRDGPERAAALVAEGGSPWDSLWERFAESPRLYPGLAKLMGRPAGRQRQGLLTFTAERNPIFNSDQEKELKHQLTALARQPQAQARAGILELEERHCGRREWVWSRMGQAPWANALLPLANLARSSAEALTGSQVVVIAAAYAERGWRCDQAYLDALSAFRPGSDAEVVAAVARTLYEPWLDAAARNFQAAFASGQPDRPGPGDSAGGEKGVCIVFVDGLRFDLGMRLASLLEARSLIVRRGHRLAPLPTVTATAKPAASPIADSLHGGVATDFSPVFDGGATATAPLLRRALEERGVQVVGREGGLDPAGTAAGGWVEFGRIDELGHALQRDLPSHLEAQLEHVAERIAEALAAGWKRVRVITDHGWLLLAGGLPKIELPSYMTATRWARCALPAGKNDLPTFPWHWDSSVQIACPPGVGCFIAGQEYAHGGASPQECVVPELVVEPDVASAHASLEQIAWRGMRCRVVVGNFRGKIQAAIREKWNDPGTSIAAPKEVGPSGEVSLLVTDDKHMNKAVSVVLADAAGKVLAHQTTVVAGDEDNL